MEKYTPKTVLKKAIADCFQYDENTTFENLFKELFEYLLEIERDQYLGYPPGGVPKEDQNKRNGFYERCINNLRGSFSIKVPRDRKGEFVPVLLEMLKKDQEELKHLAYRMYSRGMSTRDAADIIQETFGAKYSPQAISNITAGFETYRINWQNRNLENEYYFIYIDAIHTKIRRETVENEAIYVVLGLKKDLEREILGIYSIPQESSSGWQEVLEDIRKRGVERFIMCIADGITGLENSLNKVYPKAILQKCVVHKIRKILVKCRANDKQEMATDLKNIFDLDNADYTFEEAETRLGNLYKKWQKSYPWLENHFAEEIVRYYFSYLLFPVAIRRLLYTTNWIERLNKHLRKVMKNKNSFPNENSAINLLYAAIIEFEEKVYKYKITTFISSQDFLDKMLINYQTTSDTI